MWNKVPDRRYVAPPWKGSVHNKGRAVDITLISNKTGKEVEMPTGFDDFSEKAWRSSEKSERAEGNLNLLTNVMKKYGYETIETEWWHFNYRGKH